MGTVRQDQVRGSSGGDQRGIGYDDAIPVERFNVTDVQGPNNTLLDDLNYVRTILKRFHGGAAWYDITENGMQREPAVTRTSLLTTLCADPGYVSFDTSISSLAIGTAACLLTLNNYPSPPAEVPGRIGACDARAASGAEKFYAFLGVVTAQPPPEDPPYPSLAGYYPYKLCTRGHSGLFKIFNDVLIVPGQTYFLGEQGQIVTESVAVPRFEAREWRLMRIGYGVFDPTVDPSTQNYHQGILYVETGPAIDP